MLFSIVVASLSVIAKTVNHKTSKKFDGIAKFFVTLTTPSMHHATIRIIIPLLDRRTPTISIIQTDLYLSSDNIRIYSCKPYHVRNYECNC